MQESEAYHYYKLDREGQFTEFPGITIIAKIKSEHEAFWQSLFQTLQSSELITSHFSLLPYSSYHMTTVSLFTKDGMSIQQWFELTHSKLPFFQKIHQLSHHESYHFEPHVLIKNTLCRGVLMLLVKLPKRQQQQLDSFANELNLTHENKDFYHITLGYQYRKISSERQMQIDTFFKEHVDPLCTKKSIQLQAPELCFYHDMTAFNSWDGEHDPFTTENNATGAIKPLK